MESGNEILYKKIWEIVEVVNVEYEIVNVEYDTNNDFTVIDDFPFMAIQRPWNVHDAIIIHEMDDIKFRRYKIPKHSIEEYVEFINKRKITCAQVEVKDLNFLKRCPSLKCLNISLREDATEDFDYSPLYELPEIQGLSCQNVADIFSEYPIDYPLVEIDYSKVHGLVELIVEANKKTLNIDKIDTLQSLYIRGYKSKTKNLQTLFSSKQLRIMTIIGGNTASLDGIEKSEKLQCLYLYYGKYLKDISALEKVKKTLRLLCIDHCPDIEDYSVFEKMENLQTLMIYGDNKISDIQFIRKMKSLKRFRFSVNILDGDLSPCLALEEASSSVNRRHYNLKDNQLPKNYECPFGTEGIEEWMLHE